MVPYRKDLLIAAFNEWLAGKNFYTGHNTVTDRPNEILIQRIGYFLLSTALRTGFNSLTSSKGNLWDGIDILAGDYTGGGTAMQANEELSVFQNMFDFIGFKTEYSTPILFAGLLADKISLSKMETLFDTISYLGKGLKKFGVKYSGVTIRVMLIYLEPRVYQRHQRTFEHRGTQIDKVIGVGVRTTFVNIPDREYSYSIVSGLLGTMNQFVRNTFGSDFDEDDLAEILDYYEESLEES